MWCLGFRVQDLWVVVWVLGSGIYRRTFLHRLHQTWCRVSGKNMLRRLVSSLSGVGLRVQGIGFGV